MTLRITFFHKKITLAPFCLSVITDLGHGVTHYFVANFKQRKFNRWAEMGDVSWVS